MTTPRIIIQRGPSQDTGTEGSLTCVNAAGVEIKCSALELPWRDNKVGLSCIKAGTYKALLHRSSAHGWTYWLQDVPGRTEILLHPGNFAGDTSKKLRTHVLGCIMPGESYGNLYGQRAILSSKRAMQKLLTHLYGSKEIIVEVRDAAGS